MTDPLRAEEFYKTLQDDDGFRCMDTWTHAMFGLTMRFAEAFHAAVTEARVKELEEALRKCYENRFEADKINLIMSRLLSRQPTLAELEAFLKDDPDDTICGV